MRSFYSEKEVGLDLPKFSVTTAMEAMTVLSDMAEGLRGRVKKEISRSEFEATLKKCFIGSHADQQISQLWNRICGEAKVIREGELCSYLLREMQQRESQAKAYQILPLYHQPLFSSMPNTKESVCGVLSLANPPQYMTVSKDGKICVWSTTFQLQQTTSLISGQKSQRERKSPGICITSCVMVGNTLVVATTGRDLLFYETVSFKCLHKFQKLPYVPLCLTYGNKVEEESAGPGYLIWGDEGGHVGVLSFSQPDKTLFKSYLLIFNAVSDHSPLVRMRYEQAHSDWVLQVGWTGPAGYIISASQSTRPSMLIQHVSAQRKKYCFEQRMGVSCFAYSHNMEVVATGSMDHIVRLWTPFSPTQPVACLSCHTTGIVGVAISETSQHLFSLGRDLMLCVWDIREHKLLQSLTMKFPFTQRAPDFGPSPLFLLQLPFSTITVSSNEYMARFQINKGAGAVEERVDTGHTHPVNAVAIILHLCQLVSGCEGGEVRIWDIDSKECTMKLVGCHGDQELTALAVDSSGSRIITGARNGEIKVWDSLTGQNLQVLGTVGDTEIVSIVHNRERRRFLATGWNREISIFEDKELGLRPCSGWTSSTCHCDDIITMDYSPPHYLATGSFDGLTVVWNTDTEQVVSQFRSFSKKHQHTLRKTTNTVHSVPSRVSIGSNSQIPSRPVSRRLSSYRLKSASSSVLSYVPVDKVMFLQTRVKAKIGGQGTLITSEGGCVCFRDMFGCGSLLGWFYVTECEEDVVMALAVSGDCQLLLVGDTAGKLHIFNICDYCTQQLPSQMAMTPKHTWIAHGNEILSVLWAGPNVISASADSTLKMWNSDGQHIGTFGKSQLWNSSTLNSTSSFFQSTNAEDVSVDKKTEVDVSGSPKTVTQVELSPVVSSSDETLQQEVLGKDYQESVTQRMEKRLERRTHYSAIDTSSISRYPTQFSPFQALQVQSFNDVDVHEDINTVLKSQT